MWNQLKQDLRYYYWKAKLYRPELPKGISRGRYALASALIAITVLLGAGLVYGEAKYWRHVQTVTGASPSIGVITTIIIGVIVGLVLGIAAFLLFQPSTAQAQESTAAQDEVTVPTADEDKPVAEIYGTRLVSLNLIAYGNLRAKKIKQQVDGGKGESTEVVVGWAYFLDMVYAIGGVVDTLLEFRKRNEPSPTGDLPLTLIDPVEEDTFRAQTGTVTPTNGSNTGPSRIRFVDGTQTTYVDSVYEDLTGFPIKNNGISYLSMRRAFIGDNTTSVEPFQVVAQHTLENEYPWATAISGDANPAGVVYDILVRFLKEPTNRIDLVSFQDAAATLVAEDSGISLTMSTQKTAADWIQKIHDHVDSILFYNEEIGKYQYKLIRDDYDPNTLPVLDEDRYDDLVLERAGWEDVYTQLEVKWIDRFHWKLRPHRLSNDANQSILQHIKAKEVVWPFFTREEATSHALARLQRKLFLPLARITCKLSRKDIVLHPGDVVKVNSTRGEFSELICRVLGTGGGQSSDQKYDVEMVEDIFGLGSVVVGTLPDGGDESIDFNITDLLFEDAFDATPENVITPQPTVFPLGVGRVGEQVQGFTCYKSGQGGTFEDAQLNPALGQYELSGRGELDANLAPGHRARIASVVINNAVGVEAEVIPEQAWLNGERMAVMDGRNSIIPNSHVNYTIFSVREIVDLGGGSFELRDLLPVWPQNVVGFLEHLAGDPVWIAPFRLNSADKAFIGQAELRLWFQPWNTQNYGTESFIDYDYGFTVETPYAVDRLQGVRVVNDVTLTWDACEPRRCTLYQDPDTFPAEDKTFSAGLEWHVVSTGGVDTIVTSPTFMVTEPGVETYTITQLFGSRESLPQTIVI